MSGESVRERVPWEVFLRPRRGLAHQHVGSVHGADADMALANARDLYTRRGQPVSLWVVRSDHVRVSAPEEKGALFANAEDKPFRHPEHYVPLNETDGHDG